MIAAADLSPYSAFPRLTFAEEPISWEFSASRKGEGRWLPTCRGRHDLVLCLCGSNFTKAEESLELMSALSQAIYQPPVSRP